MIIITKVTKTRGHNEFLGTIGPACWLFDIHDLVATLFEERLQTSLGAACQDLGDKGAAGLQHVKSQLRRRLAERDDPDMIGLLMALGCGGHIAHHHIGAPAKPCLDLFIGPIFEKIEHMKLHTRDGIDLLQIYTDDAADGLA